MKGRVIVVVGKKNTIIIVKEILDDKVFSIVYMIQKWDVKKAKGKSSVLKRDGYGNAR